MATVFISHRDSDKARAEQLATEIRSAGHQVWLDSWEIQLGDSIIERIQEGLESSTYVFVCYSSSGITSPWMGREWMSSLARQLNGYNVKVIPVLLTGGQPPAILADLRYADLVSNWDQGVMELLSVIS